MSELPTVIRLLKWTLMTDAVLLAIELVLAGWCVALPVEWRLGCAGAVILLAAVTVGAGIGAIWVFWTGDGDRLWQW